MAIWRRHTATISFDVDISRVPEDDEDNPMLLVDATMKMLGEALSKGPAGPDGLTVHSVELDEHGQWGSADENQ